MRMRSAQSEMRTEVDSVDWSVTVIHAPRARSRRGHAAGRPVGSLRLETSRMVEWIPLTVCLLPVIKPGAGDLTHKSQINHLRREPKNKKNGAAAAQNVQRHRAVQLLLEAWN